MSSAIIWIIRILIFAGLLPILIGHARRTVLRPGAIDASRHWDRFTWWLGRHYVDLVFAGAVLICAWAALIGLWRVPGVVDRLLDQLESNVANPDATRSIIGAMAAVLASIAIFGTIIVSAIRVWTSERQTRTIEQGHVTDRLTRAIEQLGAEKTVKRVLKDADGADVLKDNVPVVVETSEPNLEVRLGAIYALERIAQDSERDHFTIMEILCAYVRENAKARDAGETPIGELTDRGEGVWEGRKAEIDQRRIARAAWLETVAPPRVDIQAAVTLIGRRSDTRISPERAAGFHLDLRGSDLRKADLTQAQMEGVDFAEARLEGANARRARLEGANFWRARLEGADLQQARLKEANLGVARLEGADLGRAELEGASLGRARLEGASLGEARLNGAYLARARLEGADLHGARIEGANLWRARLEGANLSRACLERSNLTGARLEGANLGEARLEGADLGRAGLEGADLWRARLERANLGRARLKGANLWEARLEGADFERAGLEGANLQIADFRGSQWAGASTRAAPAHFADFRGTLGLTQAQLADFIGNDGTLLPEGNAPDTGEPWYVWSCWEDLPTGLDQIVATTAGPFAIDEERAGLRAQFLCGPDNPRRRTGTRLAVDAPYPEGHPLARTAGKS